MTAPVKIHVASEDECEAADAVICCRVADLVPLSALPRDLRDYAQRVRARAAREPCGDCGKIVLVDVHSPRCPPRLCIQCANLRLVAGGSVQ